MDLHKPIVTGKPKLIKILEKEQGIFLYSKHDQSSLI